MAVSLQDQLVVAISSRALFDFEAENRVFDEDPAAYVRLQRERLDVPAAPGVALPLVRKLLAFNQGGQRRVEVVLLSRNDPVSGMRVFRSARAHGLDSIQRGVFTQGETHMPICGRWGAPVPVCQCGRCDRGAEPGLPGRAGDYGIRRCQQRPPTGSAYCF